MASTACFILASDIWAVSYTHLDIDGAVVKVNELALRAQLKDTAKNAGYQVAYKYPPERKETRLRQIELSVGRTGKITPTAVFDPVRLCGTTAVSYTHLDVIVSGGTDAGSIHVAREGVRTGGISIPCRYLHSPVEMVDLSDVTALSLIHIYS